MNTSVDSAHSSHARYIGRFAPSPTGPMHFGSLVCAVGSYLQARVAHGQWLLRIDDLDTPRVIPGAADNIIKTLAAYGFEWDGEIAYQSRHRERYAAAIETLRAAKKIYACTCSRAQIATRTELQIVAEKIRASQAQGNHSDFAESDELRYLGTCRSMQRNELNAHSLRFIASDEPVNFLDRLQGTVSQNVAALFGDFVVRRRDGIHAYHLAVTVDDHDSGVTEVVRGADLITSTPRQMLLQRALDFSRPQYCHLPLAVDSMGAKLSKSMQSLSITTDHASEALWQALHFLRQEPPSDLRAAPLAAIWNWSMHNWSLLRLMAIRSAIAPAPLLNY